MGIELNFKQPEVTIVIPSHNRSNLITQTLESVRNQTFEEFECIIVDDHSKDEQTIQIGKAYAKRDKRFKFFQLPEDKCGVNTARNFGMGISQSRYINFLDSDDVFVPYKLERQLSEFYKDPSLDMVACRHHPFIKVLGDIKDQYKFCPQENWLSTVYFPNSSTGLLWATPSPIWKKEKLEKIGSWNEELVIWTDPELNIRALSADLNIKWMDKVLVFCRVNNKNSITSFMYNKNYPKLIKSLSIGQQKLIDSGKISFLCRMNIHDRLFNTVKHISDQKGVINGINEWVKLGKKFSIPTNINLYGCFALMARIIGSDRINLLFEKPIHKYRQQLQPPLSDLENPF